MEQKIITSPSPDALNSKMKELITEGWKPIGSHGVVITHSQNRFRGKDIADTIHKSEYSQTMKKD